MQRKNSILKSSTPKSKSGMAMIMAIAVIVIIATIMALSLSLTSQTTKRTTDIYLYEQAVLVSKSVAELTLLDIARYGPCEPKESNTSMLNYTFDLDGDGTTTNEIYDVNITLKYVYKDLPSCTGDDNYTNIITDEQNGSVLMDIAVSVDDPTVTTEPIRYFRRSIQKL